MRNWLTAKPWRFRPLFADGWNYRALYRINRRGTWYRKKGRWVKNCEPVGRLLAFWRALTFPHVHEAPDD